jgi:hypothetical protein
VIDEIHKAIDTEHKGDAEKFFTQTRALGGGIIGAHQGPWQYSPVMQSAALQALGGLCILGPIKQDTSRLIEAFAEAELTEEHLTGLKAREELLIRFPVNTRDSGLISAVPRERPPATLLSADEQHQFLTLAAQAPYRSARASASDATALSVDARLERLWQTAEREGVHRAAHMELAQLAQRNPMPRLAKYIEALRERSEAHRAAQAAALLADPSQLPDPALRLREVNALMCGIDPVVSACFARLLSLMYPADPPRRRDGKKEPTTKGHTPGTPRQAMTRQPRPWLPIVETDT